MPGKKLISGGEELISFDVKTGMKNIIGRDLITDDFIAIYELVKNSYDAYAKCVTLTFKKDEIIIADNGKGMSKNDLKNKWFAVAYSAKKDGSEDKEEGDTSSKKKSHLNNLKSRRFYAGAKGVGRFSCDRLGNLLELVTRKESEAVIHKINVDWSKFEANAKQNFGDIKVPLNTTTEKTTFPQRKAHGTILRISKLNSPRGIEKLTELKRSLEKLINPFSKDSDFKIEIVVEELPGIQNDDKVNKTELKKLTGPIHNSILKVLDIKTTQVNVEIKEDKITTKLIDRGNLIYHIEEPNKHNDLIDDLDISLYFLNRSAKVNFGKIMDVRPLNYGNVFLFKNGFRVQPYGNAGDDSWGLDKNKQQGFGRFLGTRELFGKVELITEAFNEFKEVSSRDGGLVETLGKKILFELFEEKALKRLERYVTGVLWGEAFRKKNYFINGEIADKIRRNLEGDKDKDTYEDVTANLGSKIDFVNLVKSLSDDKDIKIISYDKNLVDFVNEQLEIVQPKFIQNLEKIAEKTSDPDLLNQVKLTEESFNTILKEKEDAEQREEEERKKRIEAEKKVEKERKKREEAERKQKEEEEKRVRAELETVRKEKERAEAELAKIKAEQKAKEEETKNKDLKIKLSFEKKQNQYLNATRKTLSDDAEQLVHSIDLYVGNASTYTNELLSSSLDSDTKSKIYSIKNNIDKAIKVSQIIIKSSFDYKHTKQRINLPVYIDEYVEDLGISRPNISFTVKGVFDKYYHINPIEIDIILDNLVSNSIKAKAKKILIIFEKLENKTVVNYYDDGIGMDTKLVENPDSIFLLGVRESTEKGSGIGMFDVKKRIDNLKGSIKFMGNGLKLKGVAFKIIL